MRPAETFILEQCLDLLHRRVPLEEWPPAPRNAFLGALHAESCPPPEQQKARELHHHLFRDRPVNLPPAAASGAAERVRTDLIALVPLGAGLYLVG